MEVTSALFTAFLATFLCIKVINPVASGLGLIDRPDDRKQHVGEIPLIGGIAIFVGVLFGSMIWLPDSTHLRLYIIASSFMVFLGALDDRYDLSVRVRLVGQILIASMMVFGANVFISDLGNLLGTGDIYLGWAGVLFTVVAVLGAINAFNMVDGIDGLVGTMAITTLGSITVLFMLSGQFHLSTFPLIIVMAIVPYLLFNLGDSSRGFAKIFMGDAGSMFIGLSVVWLLALGSQGPDPAFRPVCALWIIAIPLMDMSAIIMRRVKKGQSPFKPDRDHLHHMFIRAGFSSRQALVVITTMAIATSSIGILGEVVGIPEVIMFVLFLAVFAVYYYAITRAWVLVRYFRSRYEEA